MSDLNTATIRRYHSETKHRFTGLARSPDTLDWDAQPDPFRRFEGAPYTELPLSSEHHPVPYSALYSAKDTPSLPLNLESIALLMELSMAVSAWKAFGSSSWALRCNPSSGNLHPTEAYLVSCGIDSLANGLYHYRSDRHGLEQRCGFSSETQQETPLLLLGLSSVHWREAWKYGERAYRYCQLDVGHATAAISFAATTLGWSCERVSGVSDQQLTQTLGINRSQDYPKGSEQEHPDLILALNRQGSSPNIDIESLLGELAGGSWSGAANVLDRRHFYHWPIIDEVTAAAYKPEENSPNQIPTDEYPRPLQNSAETPAATVIRQRRSAQAFDGSTIIPGEVFYGLLDKCLPRHSLPPWNSLKHKARLHLVIFVHRVEGLEPGIYLLPRRLDALPLLQQAFKAEFEWEPDTQGPAHLGLHRLTAGKVEGTAVKLSCGQGIAGHSAFSLAMLAEFEEPITESPWRYRELHWEAGAIGQTLYLGAEANGLQGTGIGCFFDDGVHELLGLEDEKFQVLYHFTVGKALTDERITTLPAYQRD